MVKTLVLVRHAHRDTAVREMDNGLSEKGKEQAKQVKRFFMDRFEGIDTQKGLWLVSSPKLRCVETLAPIAKAVGRTVDIHPGLIEQAPGESTGPFEKRVAAFLEEWSRSPAALTILCSHGDWLPYAAQRLLGGVSFEHKKGGWLELEWQAGAASLKWCIPSFKSLYK